MTQESVFIDSSTNSLLSSLLTDDEILVIVRRRLLLNDDAMPRIMNRKLQEANSEAFGFLSDYFRLIIDIAWHENETKSLQFFLKSLPIKNKQKRREIEELGLFEKECILYEKLLPQLDINNLDAEHTSSFAKWHPSCYLARHDLLVLEDLTLVNFQHMPNRMEYQIHHVKCILKVMAAMHASSFAYDQHNVMSIGLEFNEQLFEPMIKSNNFYFKARMKAIEYFIFTHPKLSDYKKWWTPDNVNKILNRVYDLIEPSVKFQNVLCHRDLWHSNLMFKFGWNDKSKNLETQFDFPQCAMMVDFQFCRYSPPALDILQTIYLVTTRENRMNNFEDYLLYYYNHLKEELARYTIQIDHILSWKHFIESCNVYRLVPLVLNCTYSTLTHLPFELLSTLEVEKPDLYSDICQGKNNQFLVDFCEHDKYYEKRILECIQELLEYVK